MLHELDVQVDLKLGCGVIDVIGMNFVCIDAGVMNSFGDFFGFNILAGGCVLSDLLA